MEETTKKTTRSRKKTEETKPSVTEQTGCTFVSNSMQPYSVGEINASKIYELSENMYISGIVNQMMNLVLQSDISITVYNDKDDVVEDVSRQINQMFATDKCNINSLARSAFKDLLVWGCSIFNWVWEREGNELVCKELNHMHPYTFRVAPTGVIDNTVVYGRLLRGVLYDKADREIHYYQYENSQAKEIDRRNLFVVRDSTATYPDGDSLVLPPAPVVEFLNYAWNALGQQMYRTGAPIMFITINNPEPSRTVNGQYIEGDVEYANKILANWGKDTPFTLRENMTVNTVDVKEGSLAISSINRASESVRDYISPVGMLGKDGTLIGGNSDASLRLVNNNIKGWVSLLKNNLRILPNYYLKGNSFPETWHAEINLEVAAIEDKTHNLAVAQFLWQSKVASPNEIREKVGLEGVSDEEFKQIAEQWNILNPPTVSMGFTDVTNAEEGDNPLQDVPNFSKKEEGIMQKTDKAVEELSEKALNEILEVYKKEGGLTSTCKKEIKRILAEREEGLKVIYRDSAKATSETEYQQMQKRKEINTVNLTHTGYKVPESVLKEYEKYLKKGGTLCIERVLTQLKNGKYRATTRRTFVAWLDDMAKADAENIIKIISEAEKELKHPYQIARELKKLFEGTNHNAKTAARTEAQKIRSDTRNEAFLDNGYKYLEYVTAGDEKVREEHALRNGKIYRIEDAPWLGEYNCRCVLVPADYKVEVKGAKVSKSEAEIVSE